MFCSLSLSYTWRHPCGSKKLVWAISGYMEEFFNELKSDDFKIIQLEEDNFVGWVSFLDGMQRILLITEDVNLCYKVSISSSIVPQSLTLSYHVPCQMPYTLRQILQTASANMSPSDLVRPAVALFCWEMVDRGKGARCTWIHS